MQLIPRNHIRMRNGIKIKLKSEEKRREEIRRGELMNALLVVAHYLPYGD